MNDDQELLRAFAERKSQEAFSALVRRHLPMIFAAAFRQTGDLHRAEEISLTAFTLLARKAGSLKNHPAPGAWLYTTVGHLSARLRRTEGRRRRREQEAQAMNAKDDSPDDATSANLKPVVDEIILALPEPDRLAVVLRFFENLSYGEVGRQLGLTENAARMRVDRALERMRTQLHRRGIASTAAALGAALTANATLAPPLSLVAGISASAATATVGGGIFSLFMNTSILKTGLLVAVVGVGAGGWWWQHHENRLLQAEVAALQSHLKTRAGTTAPHPNPSTPGDNPPDRDFTRFNSEVAALPNNPAAAWQERADVLQELMAQFPEFQIPELALATPEDWLDATKDPLTSDADYRRALARVRTAVMQRFVAELRPGLQAYLEQNGGVFPTDPSQLEPYFSNPLGPEALQHYKISPASRFPTLGLGGDFVITVKSPVDGDYDTQFVLGPNGSAAVPVRQLILQPVSDAYRAANPGRQPGSLAELLPYAKTNAQRSAIRAGMGRD